MKQPRVPEYRESEGVKAYIKPLILFLKDFTMAAWTANNQRKKEIEAIKNSVPEVPEFDALTSDPREVGEEEPELDPVPNHADSADRAYDADKLGGKPLSEILLLMYPVGSIYISANAANPGTLFGGVWKQITDRFLIGAGGAHELGATGGEETHKLTADEMPAHKHGWSITGCTNAGFSGDKYNYYVSTYYSGYGTAEMYETGGDQAHNNMPPYLAVYMWKRVS